MLILIKDNVNILLILINYGTAYQLLRLFLNHLINN